MRLKDHKIDPHGISNELLLAIMVCREVYAEHETEMVITSLCDSKHSATSLHYSGNAVDLRTRDLADPVGLMETIGQRLNRHYDVILESDHLHVEYQPRRRDRLTA